jgi:hypothetical protein
MGAASTGCLQLDDSKVVSADGSAVRLWSHATGRRIATLQVREATLFAHERGSTSTSLHACAVVSLL